MPTPTQTVPVQPFSRLNYPSDPVLNAIIQDIYNKLQQIQNLVAQLTNK